MKPKRLLLPMFFICMPLAKANNELDNYQSRQLNEAVVDRDFITVGRYSRQLEILNMLHNGSTALHKACLRGYFAITHLLIESGANTNLKNSIGQSPLHLATKRQNENIVQKLLDNEADPNISDSSQETPLHLAVKVGDRKIVQLLLAKKANPNAQDIYKKTALHYASNISRSGDDVVRLLIANGAQVDSKDHLEQTALHKATSKGNIEVAEALLKTGANPNMQDRSGNTPFHFALLFGSKETANLMVQNGASKHLVNSQGKAPLHLAAAKGFFGVTKMLLDENNIEEQDLFGRTALSYAVKSNNIHLVRFLLGKNANPNQQDRLGATPLSYCEDQEISNLLIEHGAQIHLATPVTPKPDLGAEVQKLRSKIKTSSQEERNQDCVVCLKNNANVKTNCCKNPYHINCLAQWTSSNHNCPTCRSEL